ncbi:hypothetical protein ACFQAT_26180 [Undibacterium arcticum]|uniref:hypothetical protein n=1 Tax=Undibacterium arcticum TaxID=1762892 RepID=UPI00360FD871
MNTPFYYPDLELDGDIVELAKQAEVQRQKMVDAGLDRSAFESKMKTLRNNGPFEDPSEIFEDREEFLGATEIVIKGEGSELSTTSQDGSTSNGAKTVRTTPFPRKLSYNKH